MVNPKETRPKVRLETYPSHNHSGKRPVGVPFQESNLVPNFITTPHLQCSQGLSIERIAIKA